MQKTRSRGMSGTRKCVFALVACSLIVGVAGGLGEVYVRLTRKHEDLAVLTGLRAGRGGSERWKIPDAFCSYRTESNVVYDGVFVGSGVKTSNNHGYISSPDMDYKKSGDEIRIVCFGGSSTAGVSGHSLSDEETWPAKCATYLQQKLPGRKVTYLNAAQGGYSSFESYGRLWSRVRMFQPDIAVVYHGWNEMYYFRDSDKAKRWRMGEVGLSQMFEPAWFDPILGYSQLLTKVRRRMASPLGGEVGIPSGGELADDFDGDALHVWRRNLQLFRETCSLLDIDLFVCKQATLISEELSEEHKRRCRAYYHGFSYDAHLRAFRAVYEVVKDEIAADRVIDVTPLSGSPELFYDHIHPTPMGTTEIAAVVSDSILAALMKRTEKHASR